MAQALQERISIQISATEVVEATDVDISVPQPTGAKFGVAGLIGIFKGQALCRISFTFAQPATKAQFEAFALAQDVPGVGFPLVFNKGITRWLVQPCTKGDAGMRGNYETGDTSVTMSLVGAQPVQIA